METMLYDTKEEALHCLMMAKKKEQKDFPDMEVYALIWYDARCGKWKTTCSCCEKEDT